jgi:hypothetical protein
MLNQQQQVVEPSGLALGDERTLKRQRFAIGDQTKMTNLERTH